MLLEVLPSPQSSGIEEVDMPDQFRAIVLKSLGCLVRHDDYYENPPRNSRCQGLVCF